MRPQFHSCVVGGALASFITRKAVFRKPFPFGALSLEKAV